MSAPKAAQSTKENAFEFAALSAAPLNPEEAVTCSLANEEFHPRPGRTIPEYVPMEDLRHWKTLSDLIFIKGAEAVRDRGGNPDQAVFVFPGRSLHAAATIIDLKCAPGRVRQVPISREPSVEQLRYLPEEHRRLIFGDLMDLDPKPPIILADFSASGRTLRSVAQFMRECLGFTVFIIGVRGSDDLPQALKQTWEEYPEMNPTLREPGTDCYGHDRTIFFG